MSEYTEKDIEKAWECGFGAGVTYTFSHIPEGSITLDEICGFANWAELKCPWKSFDEWFEDIIHAYRRLTKERYLECKRIYAESRQKADAKGDIQAWNRVEWQEDRLDARWKRLVESGIEEPLDGV